MKILRSACFMIFFWLVSGDGLSEEVVGAKTEELQKNASFYAQWMSYLGDEAKLTEVAIPGAHNAGSYGMIAQAKTQAHEINEQLLNGVRYFDLRVTKKGTELVIFHGPIKGMKLERVLTHLEQFLSQYPSEFILLDFQHLGEEVDQDQIVALIQQKLGKISRLLRSEMPDLKLLTMGWIRAHHKQYVIMWRSHTQRDQQVSKENEFFLRGQRGQEVNLISPYDAKYHKGDDEGLITHFSTYYQSYNPGQFFVLQAQKTANKFWESPYRLEKKFRPKINTYLQSLLKVEQKEILYRTNIVMRDFIISDMDNIRYILALNLVKKLIQPAKIEEFKIYIECNKNTKK